MINFLSKITKFVLFVFVSVSCSASSSTDKDRPLREETQHTQDFLEKQNPKSSNKTGLVTEKKNSSFSYQQPSQTDRSFATDFPTIEKNREEVSNHLSCRRDEDCIFYDAECHHNGVPEPVRAEGIPDYFVFNTRLIRDEKNRLVFNPKNFKCLSRIQNYCSPQVRPNLTRHSSARCFQGACAVDFYWRGGSFLEKREAGTVGDTVYLGAVHSLTDECDLFLVDVLANPKNSLTTR